MGEDIIRLINRDIRKRECELLERQSTSRTTGGRWVDMDERDMTWYMDLNHQGKIQYLIRSTRAKLKGRISDEEYAGLTSILDKAQRQSEQTVSNLRKKYKNEIRDYFARDKQSGDSW